LITPGERRSIKESAQFPVLAVRRSIAAVLFAADVIGGERSALGSRVVALGSRVGALGSRVGALGSRVGALGSRVCSIAYFTAFFFITFFAAIFAEPNSARSAAEPERDEYRTRIDYINKRLNSTSLTDSDRHDLIVELADEFDRAAEAAKTSEARRAIFREAVPSLDSYRLKRTNDPDARMMRLRSAVFRWAEGNSWFIQASLEPTDHRALADAIAAYEDSIKRLEPLLAEISRDRDPLARNVRYRYALAIADLDRALDSNPKKKSDLNIQKALTAVDIRFDDPAMIAYVEELKARLMIRLGRLDQAEVALAAAKRAVPAPPVERYIETLVALAIAKKTFDSAIKQIDSAAIDSGVKDRLAVITRLAELDSATNLDIKKKAQDDLFARIERLRGAESADSRLALIALARALDEPERSQPASAWDALAEGKRILGEPDRAIELEIKAAEIHGLRQNGEIGSKYLFRAGGIAFQNQKFLESAHLFERIVADRSAGGLRAGAGMMRALALGRAVEAKTPGAALDDYVHALKDQVASFPDDPEIGEARILLARYEERRGNKAEALKLYEAIAPSDGRRLEARLAIAAIGLDEIENQRINGDRSALKEKYLKQRGMLINELKRFGDSPDRSSLLELALARLELVPGIDDDDSARARCDRVSLLAGDEKLRDRARRLGIVPLAKLARYDEAERFARESATIDSVDAILETLGLLDQAARYAETVSKRRALAHVESILSADLLKKIDPAEKKNDRGIKASIRLARMFVFMGDYPKARRAIAAVKELKVDRIPTRLLHDYAEALALLDDFALAATVHQARARRAPTGSLVWFQARLGEATCVYRSGRPELAKRIVDATSVLHPDLGGGEMPARFERLRNRVSDAD
jgi:hypothetical protein